MQDQPVPNSRGNARVVLLVVAALAAVFGFLFWQVRLAREAALNSSSQGPLNQLQLAFHNYHDVNGSFPPAYVLGPDGKPWHSWRILICPYIDAVDVYNEYRFDEPWDGPHNRKLANRIPGILHSPTEPPTDMYTNFAVIVGDRTPFPGSTATSLKDFKDGPASTILFVEVANAKIPWLEPRDLPADELSYTINDPQRPGPSSSRRNGPYVVFGDRITTHALTAKLRPEHLKAMTTIDGSEPLFVVKVTHNGFPGLISPGDGQSPDNDVLSFAKWELFSHVWLCNSGVTDKGLTAFRGASLSTLDLSHTNITDAGLRHLELSAIHSLILTGTKITPEGLTRLARALPDAHIEFRDETSSEQPEQ